MITALSGLNLIQLIAVEVAFELLNLLLQSDVWGEDLHHRDVGHWIDVVIFEPLLDALPLVRLSRSGDDRVGHHLHADGTNECIWYSTPPLVRRVRYVYGGHALHSDRVH